MNTNTLSSKDLSGISDLLTYEHSACKKCASYAQSFTDPELQKFASKMADNHYNRFSSILAFLEKQN